jgi:hypothetical protein
MGILSHEDDGHAGKVGGEPSCSFLCFMLRLDDVALYYNDGERNSLLFNYRPLKFCHKTS